MHRTEHRRGPRRSKRNEQTTRHADHESRQPAEAAQHGADSADRGLRNARQSSRAPSSRSSAKNAGRPYSIHHGRRGGTSQISMALSSLLMARVLPSGKNANARPPGYVAVASPVRMSHTLT